MERLIAGARKLGINLSLEQTTQFETYYREMIDWNQKVNLTAIAGYEDIQIKHFLDSLTVAAALRDYSSGSSVIDIGTGAGLPGIPLRIAFPDIRLVLLEATGKKAEFLRSIVAKLGLEHVEVVVGRAEDVAHDVNYREKFDLALSRAVASLPALAELVLPFCALDGLFVAQKKGDIAAELNGASKAITVMGGKLREVQNIALEEFADGRCLLVIDKVAPTPDKYPRRPGLPVKRPILG
jgi:16S rRNA (guanine527-N7)-methyltransferase